MAGVLELSGVVAGYGARTVLTGVDLEVAPGQLWAVLGPNGAGKSTLVRAALGLVPASAGQVRIAGRAVTTWDRKALARTVAWVPQHTDQVSGFTGLELALMGRSPYLGAWGLSSRADAERALEVLRELGVDHLAHRPVDRLSGGERRLLYFARALVQTPALLLLDEPTAFLDLRHQVEALGRVRARVDAGMAAVAVLHDVNLAAGFADHVLLLAGGAVVASGPAAEVLEGDVLERVYATGIATAVASGGQRLFAPRARG